VVVGVGVAGAPVCAIVRVCRVMVRRLRHALSPIAAPGPLS